jgi:hypothetical protein
MSKKCGACNVKWAFADGLCRGCIEEGKTATPATAAAAAPAPATRSGKENSGAAASGAASEPKPKKAFVAVGPPKETCTVCSGTVYAAEKAIVRSRIFHVTCLKCSDCGKKLNAGSVELDAENKIFCNVHFTQRKMSGSLTIASGNQAAVEAAGGSNIVSGDMGERFEETKANATTSLTGAAFNDMSWQKAAKKDACKKCGDTVYLAEKMEGEWKRKGKDNKQLYHKACFRCVDCNTLLQAGQYEMCPIADEPRPKADLLCRRHHSERRLSGAWPLMSA